MSIEKLPPANDNSSKEEQEAQARMLRSYAEAFQANEDIARLTEEFSRSLATLETYVASPNMDRRTAEKLYEAAAAAHELLAARRMDSPDTFAYDPGFIALGARLDAARGTIEQTP